MTAGFTTVEPRIPRDRWKRPLIIPPGGGAPVGYTRVTTLAKTLEEQSALAAWKQRMTLLGVTIQPHIALAAAAAKDDKDMLNDLAEQALAAAQAGAKAQIGTALHTLTEKRDRGEDTGPVPAEYQADLDAYEKATTGIRWVALEQFLVVDDLQVAGTADGIGVLPDGRCVIADKKTGSIDYAALSIAVQLACYSRGKKYDPATGQRTPIDVDQAVGLVIHMPSGSGTATLINVDLTAGWEAAQASAYARGLRSKCKAWLTPHVPGPAALSVVQNADAVTEAACAQDDLADLIAAAPTPAALGELWRVHGDAFTPDHIDLAAARHALLTAGAVA